METEKQSTIIYSAIDLKQLEIKKQGTDGLRLEILENNVLGEYKVRAFIVVDFKDLRNKLNQEVKND